MKMSFEEALEYMRNGGATRPITYEGDLYFMIDGQRFVDGSGNVIYLSYEDIISDWNKIKIPTVSSGSKLVCRNNTTKEKMYFYVIRLESQFFAVSLDGKVCFSSYDLTGLAIKLKDNYTIIGAWDIKDLIEED